MVYSKVQDEVGIASGGYVISILVNGQVMSEQADGTVVVPFETEYQIRLRNKTAGRAMAKVYIDEDCVTPEGLIVNSNNYVDLDRPTTKPMKFKFVAVDSFEALDEGKHQLNNPAMGVIRVEFYKERSYAPQPVHIHHYHYDDDYVKPWLPIRPYQPHYRPLWCGSPDSYSVKSLNSVDCGPNPRSATFNCSLEAGATVSGGHSNQNFVSVYFNEDNSAPTVLRLVLKGYWADEVKTAIPQPALVRYCPKCNAKRKRVSARFCEICGSKF